MTDDPTHSEDEREDAKARVKAWFDKAPKDDAPALTGDLDDPALQDDDE